jgi:hypothetical protein
MMGRVIREAMIEAHKNKIEFGNDWYVLNDSYKSVVKLSYFYDDDGNKKDKPFKDIYSTADKTYSRGRHLVEYLDDQLFIVDADHERNRIPEELKDKYESFSAIIRYFRDNFMEDVEWQDSYMNILGTHMFTSIRFKCVESKIFESMRSVDIFNDIRLDMNVGKEPNTFHIDRNEEDDFIFTFFVKAEKFDLDRKQVYNMLKSLKGVEKFNLA